jgi:hypothetical protein
MFAIEITEKEIKSLLCTAFDGGIFYWCHKFDYQFPEGISEADFREGGKFGADPDEKYFDARERAPLMHGCSLILHDLVEGKKVKLDRAAIERGIKAMRELSPFQFGNWMGGREDAETGDVFVQCCVFGEVVYG